MGKLRGKRPGILTSQQILESLAKSDVDWCLPWPRARNKGYGQAWVDGVRITAHRAMLYMTRGAPPSPDQNFAIHACDTPECVNWKHLRWGSQTENMRDMVERGRRGKGKKLSASEVVEIFSATGTHKSVADRYGVHENTVYGIRTGRIWRKLTA